MEIEYQEFQLSTILGFFVKGFELPKDKEIYKWEPTVDAAKDRVVFKLYVTDRKKSETGTNVIF